MQSVLFSAIVVLCIVSTTLAALALGPAQVHSSHPNECHRESTNEFYKPGDSWNEPGCQQASCIQVNYTGIPRLMISYATCGVVAVDPPCYLTENEALSYPDCCPEPTCPDESQEEEPHHNTKEEKPKSKVSKPEPEPQHHQEEEASKENHHESENELMNDHHNRDEYVRQQQQNSFRTSYPWDDYYLYGDQDHMDNNVDNDLHDLQYLDYYQNERSSSPSRFTRHDFNIDNFKWF